ncbi:uncharacterized protein LOC131606928 [Vicia villosa]|uniref:uncharacterized protein LOC131606928 n=1 Tax=Vicia villosa TaxID=3911 RepID=UPI00273B6462|nr:uncharacterized protein LOC131606928 [Vicia villosa]
MCSLFMMKQTLSVSHALHTSKLSLRRFSSPLITFVCKLDAFFQICELKVKRLCWERRSVRATKTQIHPLNFSKTTKTSYRDLHILVSSNRSHSFHFKLITSGLINRKYLGMSYVLVNFEETLIYV